MVICNCGVIVIVAHPQNSNQIFAGLECYDKTNDPKGEAYRGTQSTTSSGLRCQNWAEDQPNNNWYNSVRYVMKLKFVAYVHLRKVGEAYSFPLHRSVD